MPTPEFPDISLDFGIFDWFEEDEELSPAQVMEDRLALLEFADQAGFYCYHVAEHQGTPLSLSTSPIPILAAAAQRTSRLRLGPLTVNLPWYHPLRLYQEICQLDHLSHGRLEFGIGRGTSPKEAALYNVQTREEAVARFTEALSVIMAGFQGRYPDLEGQYYRIHDVTHALRPYQNPYPPLWYPTTNLESIPWVARHGFHTANMFIPASEMRPAFESYKEHWTAHRSDPERMNGHVDFPRLGIVRHVYVGDTDEGAIRAAWPHFLKWVGHLTYFGSARRNWLTEFDYCLGNNILIAGSPATVARQVQKALADSGANYFCGVFAFGNLPQPQVMESTRCFAQEVMPLLSTPTS